MSMSSDMVSADVDPQRSDPAVQVETKFGSEDLVVTADWI
jgi:hypothetical protein